MERLGYLSDYIIITEPILTKDALKEILSITDVVKWRIPDDMSYHRTCTSFPISFAVMGKYPVPEGQVDNVKKVDMTLLDAMHQALRIYKAKFPVRTKCDSGFDILRYETGQFIGYHIDDEIPRVRTH